MSRGITLIFTLTTLTVLVLAFMMYYNTSIQSDVIKQNMSLSANVLSTSIETTETSYDVIADGYESTNINEVIIDKDTLLADFNYMLKSHFPNSKKYNQVKNGIRLKILVYHDSYYIADQQDKWSFPHFFTYESGGVLYYINSLNNECYYYDATNTKIQTTIDTFGLSDSDKQLAILGQINSHVEKFTYSRLSGKSINIKIDNPYESDMSIRRDTKYFNPLDDITFFVVYSQNEMLGLANQLFMFPQHEVVGYTLQREDL